MADNILSYNDMMFTQFEPKMRNRYYMEWKGIKAFMVKATQRPSIQFETVVLDHINIKRKLQGKGDWQDINVTLYDPIVPSAAQAVMEWVRLGHESLTGRKGYAAMYKEDISFKILGPVGDIVEEWTLKGAFITNAQFGDLSFDSSEVVDIQLTLSYDYAILQY